MAYLKGDFFMDILPIIPFDLLIPQNYKIHRLLYLIKIIRFKRGVKLFNPNKIMNLVKKIFKD